MEPRSRGVLDTPHARGMTTSVGTAACFSKRRSTFHTKGPRHGHQGQGFKRRALAEGDSVTLIKDLKRKGSSTVLKRGTVIRNIHLTDNEDEIEGRTDKVKGLVLRTEFLKKA
jgi:protein PhnA